MLNKIKLFFNYLIAKDEKIELKHRLLIFATLIAIIVTIIGSITNIFLATGIIAKLLPFLALILVTFFYYQVRFGNKIEVYSIVIYFLSLSLVFLIAIFNGGVESGNIMTLILVMVLGTIILPKNIKLFGFLYFLLSIFALFSLDYLYPETINYFTDRSIKYLDILIGTLSTSISLYFLIYFLYESYYKEHHLLLENEKKLKALNQQLSDSLSTKEKFYTIIAHDLRNPIYNYHITTNLLLEDYDNMPDEEKKEFLTLIRNSSKELQEMLETLLNLLRNNKGILPVTIETSNLNAILINSIDFFKLQAINKEIEIINNYTGDMAVEIDKSYVDIILRNLISNAIKFSNPNSKITLEVEENYSTKFVKISIKDNGIGIPESIQSNIFQVDKLITSKGTNKETGNGLGLLLCKEFVEKLGGEIWFESEENNGTNFFFTLKKTITN